MVVVPSEAAAPFEDADRAEQLVEDKAPAADQVLEKDTASLAAAFEPEFDY